MIVHQVYAYIWKETVMNVVVCDNYELANNNAKGSYGNDAFAVDCCSIHVKLEINILMENSIKFPKLM